MTNNETTSKFTPPPWETKPLHMIYGGADPVAMLYNYGGHIDANAALIAAAPDLLAALEEICNNDFTYFKDSVMLAGGEISWADIRAGRAAIAKARGVSA